MLRIHAPLAARAAAAAMCLASTACSTTDDETRSDLATETPEIEEPLTLTACAVDVRHGGLRIEATMTEGFSDVSMWLGSACETSEVGRGIATSAGFAWSLSADDLARAIECNLVVKARGRTDGGLHVCRTAGLEVTVVVAPEGAESEGRAAVGVVRLFSQETDGSRTRLSFEAPARAAHLHVGGTVVGAEDDDSERNTDAPVISSFSVDNADLSRAALSGRHLAVFGEPFVASITIETTTIDGARATPANVVVDETVTTDVVMREEDDGEPVAPFESESPNGIDEYVPGEPVARFESGWRK